MDPGPQAYGAGKVGGEFNVQNFVRKPHVFVRLLSLVSVYAANAFPFPGIGGTLRVCVCPPLLDSKTGPNKTSERSLTSA